MIENIGLFGALFLLIVLALRGRNIIFSALLASLVVIVTNPISLADSLNQYFIFGKLGAFSFAGKFFILFACGAMFGRVMGESKAATSIAFALADKLGAQRTLWIVTIACALLTYSGVVVFVVIFAIYPLGLKLIEQANIPKRLLVGAITLGSGTFTLTALPGTPSIQNVIASSALGTDLFAAPLLGIIATIIMFGAGIWYLETQRKAAQINNEGLVNVANDASSTSKETLSESVNLPHWSLAIIPLFVVIFCILTPRILSGIYGAELTNGDDTFSQLMTFATTQIILWPSISLFIGCIVGLLIFKSIRVQAVKVLGDGTQDSILPLINTAAVIGFGGVVTQTQGFADFVQFLLTIDLPPLLSMFVSVSLSSSIVGSSAGGLQIFLQTMAESYLALGIPADVLHRIATIASGGFDSLPHCGAVVAILTITGMTHKQAYKDIFVITVVFPVISALAIIGWVAFFY
ncbi:GntP family permease [Thalassotalea sp. G2M2-11]|uniref:GntP family permease n=1 Tax=Thalassotalea sp. G2M2-11 TaxID=2787627 RepID=UPI0019D26099|nr:GntP family permease [Thalassotalea sp. G2M2-11]